MPESVRLEPEPLEHEDVGRAADAAVIPSSRGARRVRRRSSPESRGEAGSWATK
jgi:hypothetical protein